ncbi:hypothetical protein HDU86_005131 [Geranomyces michiganensis]|nr:hypothetical protein HDU86_005131 [Geranomyces michiganensis]
MTYPNSPRSNGRLGTTLQPSRLAPRNALALNSLSDDDNDEADSHRAADGQDELVHELSGADFTGAQRKQKQKTLVIPLIKQNHWRNGTGGGEEPDLVSETPSNPSPNPKAATQPASISQVETQRGELQDTQPLLGKGWGLQVMKKRAVEAVAPAVPPTAAHEQTATTEVVSASQPQTVEEEAVAAVLRDAMDDASAGHSAVDYLPLIAQNVVPGLAELTDPVDKYRHDVSQRPDELAMDDYNRVPIEEFGAALLRGMGWENGRPVGKNPKGLTEPISLKSRPHLLGLGATPAPVLEPKIKKYIKPGEKRAADPLAEAPSRSGSTTDSPRISRRGSPYSRPDPPKTSNFKVGDRVSILAGRHKGSSGAISEIKARDSGTVIKVTLADGEVGRVWPQDLAPATSLSDRSVSSSSQSASWLRPNIRVRVVSKSLSRGAYYNQKGVIQDVFTAGECVLRLDSGELIEGVKTRHLQTVLPSRLDTHVCIVDCRDVPQFVGQLGTLIERNDANDTATVRMEHTLEYRNFSFDEIAEHVESH